MRRDRFLRNITSGRRQILSGTCRLGEGAREYVAKSAAQLRKSAAVVDNWQQVVPSNLYEHCELRSVAGGVLGVEVEPGVYMHEFRVIEAELVGRLAVFCPQAAIKQIKLIPRRKRPGTKEEQ